MQLQDPTSPRKVAEPLYRGRLFADTSRVESFPSLLAADQRDAALAIGRAQSSPCFDLTERSVLPGVPMALLYQMEGEYLSELDSEAVERPLDNCAPAPGAPAPYDRIRTAPRLRCQSAATARPLGAAAEAARRGERAIGRLRRDVQRHGRDRDPERGERQERAFMIRRLRSRLTPNLGCAEEGFTLLELVVALALSAFAFAALASMLLGGMKALSVQKTRSQGNEFATQAIEDLQRFDFNDLGLCPSTSDPSPTTVPTSVQGLTTVQLANCSSGSLVYEQPCVPLISTLSTFPVPRQTYACTSNNISYSVSRFVVWADAAKTAKRLAVYVSWRDAVGAHQVAQESSLRSPNSASIIGISPPQFVSVSVSAPSPALIASDGTLQSTIVLSAVTNGLTASDSVSVTLNTLVTQPDGTVAAVPTQFTLSSADGVNWSLTLPGNPAPLFGAGSQYVTFTEVRSSGDGKANSRVASSTIGFCQSGGCPANLPSIASATVSPTSINIDTGGVLQSTFTISVTTANLSTDATVTALVQTQTGASSIQLQPSTSCLAGESCNSWSTTVAPGTVNFRFSPGNQTFFITATQPVSGSGGTSGSSAVATTNTVLFA